MSSKTFIELEWEQIDSIVLQELKKHHSFVLFDYNNRKDDGGAVFENDKEKDLKVIKKHLKSFERLIKYYGGSIDEIKDTTSGN
jgi:hypothetical protein